MSKATTATEASGATWLKSRTDQIASIWERKRAELIKLFDANSQWLADTKAKLRADAEQRERAVKLEAEDREQHLKMASKKRPAGKKGKIVDSAVAAFAEVSPLNVSIMAPASIVEPATARKRGRRKKSEIPLVSVMASPVRMVAGTDKSTASSPNNTAIKVKKPRGRPKKGRPSDTFTVQPAARVLTATPKTPKTVNAGDKEGEEIQSGKFSVKKTAAIVIPSVKRSAKKAAAFESVKKSKLANVVEQQSDDSEDTEVGDQGYQGVVEDNHNEDVIKHTIADEEPFVESKKEPVLKAREAEEEPKQQQQQQQPTKAKTEWVTVTQQEAAAASFLPSPAFFNNSNNNNTKHQQPEDLPKVDSWTSQFLLKPKQLDFNPPPPHFATSSALKTPAAKKTAAPPQSSTKKRRGLHLVDAPLPIIAAAAPKPAVPTFTGPPIVNDALPEESPLTKAKRLDSEYAQREQKLKAFLASGSDDIKKKLDNLRSNPQNPVVASKPATSAVDSTPSTTVVEKPTDILKMLEQQQPRVSAESASETESSASERCVVFVPLQPPPEAEPLVPIAHSNLPKPRAHANILHETPPDAISKMSAMDDPIHSSTATNGNRTDSFDSAKSTASTADHFDTLSSAKTTQAKPQSDPRAAVEEQRRRLQERQNKAIERRKQLHEKAQAAKLPKEPSFIVKPSSVAPSAKTSAAPKQLREQPQQHPKQSQQPSTQPMTPDAQKSYKLPLPKTRSPMVPVPTPQPNVVKAAGTPDSLPEIRSEEDPSTLKKKNVPHWAKTPNLVSALANQSTGLRPEDIFGDVQPIKLEDFFKGKKFSRSSTSGWNHHY